MKKLFWLAMAMVCGTGWFTSCRDTETYAELVDDEKEYISTWIKSNPYHVDFGNIKHIDEEKLNNITEAILEDSIHPSHYIELNQWYTITEGNFKRLYFCIKDWGNDGLKEKRQAGIEPTAEEELNAMRNRKKFFAGKNVLVRYDSLYLLNGFDYDDADGDGIDDNSKGDNLDPNSYIICYNWNASYYATNYYAMYYSSGSSYECSSGGLGFPVRFLWEGGKAAIICPFSLVPSTYSSYYYTLYYGDITYTKPTYLPQ